MSTTPAIKLYSFTLDCLVPDELAAFYAALLGWEMRPDSDFACVYPPDTPHGGYPCLLFQRNPDYQAPIWPEEAQAQQKMAHLDLAVSDVAQAAAHAIRCGARQAPQQFSDHWLVMFDPSGHPFCLCDMKELMQSKDFALR